MLLMRKDYNGSIPAHISLKLSSRLPGVKQQTNMAEAEAPNLEILSPEMHNSTVYHDTMDAHHRVDSGGTLSPLISGNDSIIVPTLPGFNDMSTIKVVVLSVMFLISFVGNCATLVQMVRMRRRKSTINTLILHLVTSDLIVTFFCNITDAVWTLTVQWYGEMDCVKL